MSLHSISLELHSLSTFLSLALPSALLPVLRMKGRANLSIDESIQFSELGKTGLLFPRHCREGSHKHGHFFL